MNNANLNFFRENYNSINTILAEHKINSYAADIYFLPNARAFIVIKDNSIANSLINRIKDSILAISNKAGCIDEISVVDINFFNRMPSIFNKAHCINFAELSSYVVGENLTKIIEQPEQKENWNTAIQQKAAAISQTVLTRVSAHMPSDFPKELLTTIETYYNEDTLEHLPCRFYNNNEATRNHINFIEVVCTGPNQYLHVYSDDTDCSTHIDNTDRLGKKLNSHLKKEAFKLPRNCIHLELQKNEKISAEAIIDALTREGFQTTDKQQLNKKLRKLMNTAAVNQPNQANPTDKKKKKKKRKANKAPTQLSPELQKKLGLTINDFDITINFLCEKLNEQEINALIDFISKNDKTSIILSDTLERKLDKNSEKLVIEKLLSFLNSHDSFKLTFENTLPKDCEMLIDTIIKDDRAIHRIHFDKEKLGKELQNAMNAEVARYKKMRANKLRKTEKIAEITARFNNKLDAYRAAQNKPHLTHLANGFMESNVPIEELHANHPLLKEVIDRTFFAGPRAAATTSAACAPPPSTKP